MQRSRLVCLGGVAAAASLLVALASPAQAQDALEVARQKYQECKTLLDAGQACDAAAACKAGLEARKNRALEKLAAEADAACAAARQAADASDPTKKKPRCSDGQEIIGGHCCWPGQGWTGKSCAGIPTSCPADHVADLVEQTCVPGACADGTQRHDTGHCCWPGQSWSPEALVCDGQALCPAGYIPHAESGCAPDRDDDRIADGDDRCPAEPEDYDLFEDDDGCIDIDNDQDGLVDTADSCPDEAEDRDRFDDGDGCPEADNDGDQLADAVDQCPDEAEDLDQFQDDDGCPELDNDQDGVADASDRCPLEPEDRDRFEDVDGCPEEGTPPLPPMVIAGWASAGTGLALTVAATGLFVAAELERDRVLDADPDAAGRFGEPNQVESHAIQDRADLYDTVGVVLVSAGGAALVTGAVLLVLEYTADELDEGVPEVGLAPLGDGLAASLGLRF